MINLNKFIILICMLLHDLNGLTAAEKFQLSNDNLTLIKTDLRAEKHKLIELEQTTTIEKEVSQTEEEATANPLYSPDSSAKPLNRTGRQLYYSPNFFFVTNYASEGSNCITSRGLVGVCMPFDKCLKNQQLLQQPIATQQWPLAAQALTNVQQQPEICTYYNQFGRSSYDICCVNTLAASGLPVHRPATDSTLNPAEPSYQLSAENYDDSEVLEADLSSYQPPPPTYDNTDNTATYDPIENLKQGSWLQDNSNINFIRYPWPQQLISGFAGVQQWPPPVPTHPPSLASWPPPLPTHPPNHHYPTHPPSNGNNGAGSAHFYPTTRRPQYPSSPAQRPASTATSSTSTTSAPLTTKRPAAATPTSMLGLPLQCGLKNVENPDQERIVGGTNASPHEFPWIAALFKSGKQFCGGSLITNNHILTAAHCVARMTSWDVASLTVHLGDYNIRTDFEVRHVTRRIKRVVRHKGFDFSTLHNDIAILTLSEPVQYTKEIQPICLPTSAAQQSRSYSGQIATVAGWGSLVEGGPQPSILQKVQIPIWTNAECAQKYGRAAPAGIISSMICAGQVAKDSCSGDSGGALIVSDGARYLQVGIVSWGIGCGKGQYPGVYTRVTSLLPWIYKNIK